VDRERARLLNFIRRRVPDPRDAEDILQDVFYELVEANRLLMPIDHITGWLFRVARNRIIDLFRKKENGELQRCVHRGRRRRVAPVRRPAPFARCRPRRALRPQRSHRCFELAVDGLPPEQREVFVAHEIEGLSFKEIAARSGVGMNTLLSRKRYAVLHLRERLQGIYDDFTKT